MDLENFNINNLNIKRRDLQENKANSDFTNNFINELKEYLEKAENVNRKNINRNNNRYSNYWEYQNFMEDNVAAKIGLSRWGTDITYYDELNKIVDESILEISKTEGTLYRKQFVSNGSDNKAFYNIDKFENGEITHLTMPKNIIPSEFEKKDLIFQYKTNDVLTIRNDLKEKIINLASQKAEKLRKKEQEINNEFKKEGHIYEAFEDDGYIFLNDLTEKRDFSIEDIDFVVDNYNGDGKYQVKNGIYEKII